MARAKQGEEVQKMIKYKIELEGELCEGECDYFAGIIAEKINEDETLTKLIMYGRQDAVAAASMLRNLSESLLENINDGFIRFMVKEIIDGKLDMSKVGASEIDVKSMMKKAIEQTKEDDSL